MKFLDNVDICFNDNHLLVVSKPPNLLTQPDRPTDESLERMLKSWIKKEAHKEGNVFLHCVHRLDRPVSGLVIFAKTSKALSRLNEQSRALEIQRVYIAEVEGSLSQKMGRLDHYLIHGDHRSHVVKEGTEGAKHARLNYEVLHYTPHSTFVKVELETGRYHQIRAQFSAIGHPIVGDTKYGSRLGVGGDTREIHLHCTSIAFSHPVTKELVKVESPPPFGL